MLGKVGIAAVGLALAFGAAPAAALEAVPGGCALLDRTEGCERLTPHYRGDLDGYSEGMAASPDGRNVYYVYGGNGRTRAGRIGYSSVLYALRRDPASGRLTRIAGSGGCASPRRGGGCAVARGLDRAWAVTVSDDGRFVYVASYNSEGVAIFRRNSATGALRQLAGRDGCQRGKPTRFAVERCRFFPRSLEYADSIRIVPGGRLAYVGGVAFQRSRATGLLSPATTAMRAADGKRQARELSLGGHGQYVFSPDGRFAYEPLDAAVVVHAIDGRSGRLRRVGCIECDAPHSNYFGFTLSPDGRFAYTARQNQLQAHAIDPQSGRATPVGPLVDPCATAAGTRLDCDSLTEDMEISADGRSVYAASSLEVVEVARDPQTGALSPTPAPSCVGDVPGCAPRPWLGDGLFSLRATPDGGVLLHVESGVIGLRR